MGRPRKEPEAKAVVVRESFAYADKDGTVHIARPGDTHPATAAIVKGRETLFEPGSEEAKE